MEIYLIRHTKPDCYTGICYGQADIEISGTEEELNSIKNKLTNTKKAIYYTSPLKRCLKLAEYLGNSKFISDRRIMEINFGDWELKKWTLIEDQEIFQNWRNNFVEVSCPNGESFLDLYQRSIEFFEEIIKKDHQEVAIVTHAGVIRCILSYILEIPLKKVPNLQIDYGGVSKIKILDYVTKVEYINK